MANISEVVKKEKKTGKSGVGGKPLPATMKDFILLFDGHDYPDGEITRINAGAFLQPFSDGKELTRKFGVSFDEPCARWFEDALDDYIKTFQQEFWSPKSKMPDGSIRMLKRAARGGFLYGTPFSFKPKTTLQKEIDDIKKLQATEDREAGMEKEYQQDKAERKGAEKKEKKLRHYRDKMDRWINEHRVYCKNQCLVMGYNTITDSERYAVETRIRKLNRKQGLRGADLSAYIKEHENDSI